MKNFCLKVEENFKKAYSLSSKHFPSSDWKRTLAADPNIPKLNYYSFLHQASSNHQVIILPQSTLTPPRLPYLQRKIIKKQKIKREDKEYYEANDINSITVSDGFVKFTKHFRYLGIFVSYNLCNDYNVDRRLASASSSMGALNHVWKEKYANIRS